ncbi:MAG: HPr family phosphocarrier protein [Blastocatellia bacterium]|nr:HPr family phosphocarrier protein [Blastocatellia bacterium]
MQQRRLVISNSLGMHARAAARFVRLAGGFSSEIQLARSDALQRTVNAKSIFSVLLLAATKGTMIDIIVEGPDELEAIESLSRLIEDNFGED